MPPFGPIKRRELIRCLRLLGFEGPWAGRKHQYMTRGRRALQIPNPHRGEISRNLLAEILREAGVERDTWEAL